MVCGWEVKETIEQGCTKDSCSMRPAPQRWQRYDFPQDITHEKTQLEMLRWLRKRHYRYMTIWTGAQYVFQVWDAKSILINKHHVNLGIAIVEAILELP